jgi:molybdopterin converting factor small subunit
MEVQLFGIIAEKAKTDRLDLSCSDTTELEKMLKEHVTDLGSLSYAIAVDKKIVREKTPLNEDSVVAILPPFAGG